MHFSKAHAYGNDFLYVRRAELDGLGGVPLDALAIELCNRHTGIGADGLIVYEPTSDGASMRLWNADGGRAEVSGNGVRALGALLLRDNPEPRAEVTILTDAGPKLLVRSAHEGSRQVFRAAMGLPRDVREMTVSSAGESLELIVVNFGNPHAVILGPLPDVERFRKIGGSLEHHEAFPGATNVEFVQVDAPDIVRILLWERGVGPTLSSGTGSCASLIAAAAFGGASREADVIAPGGSQRVAWRDDSVYLTGWAEVLFDGEWLRQIPRTA